MSEHFDALLVLSFGGPERPEDVMPFLENVTRGRGVPRERLLEVAGNYALFGGQSPINEQCRALIAALRTELDAHGVELPIYWGNRNWHPFLEETMRAMCSDGVRRALVFVTSAYGSYSACRQYLEDIEKAKAAVGGETPSFERLPHYCLLPGFIEPLIANVSEAFAQIPAERRAAAKLLFTAHSIPLAMVHTSDYLGQLQEVARLVAEGVPHPEYRLVFQSRSGPPHQPWLEPDIRDALRAESEAGAKDVVVAPIGFISDHMEVKFDLDTQAHELANALGLHMVRAATVGTHPQFVAMIRELIEQRLNGAREACPWPCTATCCPIPQHAVRPAAR